MKQRSEDNIKVSTDFLGTLFAESKSKRFFVGSRPNDAAEKIDSPHEEKFINKPRNGQQLPEFLRTWDRPGSAMYFCVGILRDNATRRRKVNIAESCFLHADIDLKNIVGVKTVDDLVAKLMSLSCPPSKIVASGHGAHAYWIFEAPISSDEIERIEVALKLLADLVGADHEPTHIAAFLRLPGSHNTKNGGWNEVRIVEQNARRYTLDEIESWLGETAPIIKRKERESKNNSSSADDRNCFQQFGDENPKPKPINIRQRLAAMAYRSRVKINSIHVTQRDVSAAMVNQGHKVEKIVATILAATKKAVGPKEFKSWNWKQEEVNIRKMTLRWITKTKEELENEATPEPAAGIGGEIARFDPWEEFNAPLFPTGILPSGLEYYVKAAAENIGGDPGAMAMCIMSAMSGAIDHRTKVKMMKNGSWYVSPRLWLLLVGDPSKKKTPLIDEALLPLEKFDAELIKKHREDMAAYLAMPPEVQAQIDEPDAPPRYMVYDTSVEKLAEILAVNEKGLIVKRDELSGWIGDMERYGASARGAGSNRAFYLKGFDGGAYRIERIGRKGSDYIPNLSLSIIGGLQPKKLAELKGLTSDGLLQRFVAVMMKDANFLKDCAVDNEAYESFIRNLARQNPRVFELQGEAYERMMKIQKRLFDIGKSGTGIAPGFTEHVGKLSGLAGSFALLLHYAHVAHYHDHSKIATGTVEKVGHLIDSFILPHSLEFYRAHERESSSHGDMIRKVASWILTSKRARFTASDLTTNVADFRGLGLFDINRQIAPLVATDWVKPTAKGLDNRAWTVADWAHPTFAERTLEEEKRKRELAWLMNSQRRP